MILRADYGHFGFRWNEVAVCRTGQPEFAMNEYGALGIEWSINDCQGRDERAAEDVAFVMARAECDHSD